MAKELREHSRVALTNSVCNCGRDSTRPHGPATDRYGDPHRSRFVRLLAGSATLISIDELVLVGQNFEPAPPQRASSRSAVGRVERRGEAAAACPRSATGSISLLWRPCSLVGCAVRGRPSAISSPGIAATTTPPERGWTACTVERRTLVSQALLRRVVESSKAVASVDRIRIRVGRYAICLRARIR